MAQHRFTAALNASDIPFISRSMQRPTIMGQLDNKLRSPTSSNAENRENNPQNLPQIIYAENVMPTRDGISSVGYHDAGAPFPAGGTADEVFTVYDIPSGTPRMWCPANGKNYVKLLPTDPWVAAPAGALVAPVNRIVSTAFVNGKSYICYDATFIGHFDQAVPSFIDDSAALIGIAVADIRAICASGNYLVAIKSDNSIAWSSLTNPLDFTPSVTTGAGTQIPVDMKGVPLYLTPLSGGFLIHCTLNVIAAVYTQNSAQPWIFREVKGSGGIGDATITIPSISKSNNSANVYAWNTFGLQSYNLREAETLHPTAADFIAGGRWETYNSGTKLLSLQVPTFAVQPKVAVLANRFICMSYGNGTGSYNYAIIYDSELRRWGKLKIEHMSIVHFSVTSSSPAGFFYALQSNGQLKNIEFIAWGATPPPPLGVATVHSGVIILGRYSLTRGSRICSQELELECLESYEAITANLAVNYNGTTVGEINPMTLYTNYDNYRQYQKQKEGETLSYIIEGTFHLASAIITATKGADF